MDVRTILRSRHNQQFNKDSMPESFRALHRRLSVVTTTASSTETRSRPLDANPKPFCATFRY